MKLTVTTSPAKPNLLTVHFFTKEERKQLPQLVSEAEFPLSANSLLRVHHANALCVGLGSAAKVNANTIRQAASAAAKFLRKSGHTEYAVHLGKHAGFAGEAAEGIVVGSYQFEQYKAADKKTPAPERVTFVVPSEHQTRAEVRARRGVIFGEAANRTRQLANQPPNVVYPQTLAEAAGKIAKEFKLGLTVFDEKDLRKGGFGGLLAVGGASAHPPRLIVLRYNGGKKGAAPVALVGKAVTFDSGGLSIKPAAGMEDMVFDKCGGCTVLGTMAGIAALKLKINVVGIVSSAENLLSGESYRPGDVVTVYDGKHIEINNTDAEGRVILADALGYAVKNVKAAQIIDLATLTGAIVVALGEHVSGMWSTSKPMRTGLLDAAERAGEKLWHMPLFPEYEEQIRSNIALIKNSSGRPGGANTAATFLKTFVGDTPWAHIDIAGTAAADKDSATLARGATGFAVRTLLEYLSEH